MRIAARYVAQQPLSLRHTNIIGLILSLRIGSSGRVEQPCRQPKRQVGETGKLQLRAEKNRA